ncbi:MAG: DHHA1 domain-containing protein, partial [Clostridia bacterium]|nr:DHHA1 domain-containing protein [Clostridia bacterium]
SETDDMNEARTLADSLSEKAEEFAAVLFGENGGRYVIISKTGFDLSALCKEFNKVFSGRGGGRNGIVQGSVSSPEKAEKFLKECSF